LPARIFSALQEKFSTPNALEYLRNRIAEFLGESNRDATREWSRDGGVHDHHLASAVPLWKLRAWHRRIKAVPGSACDRLQLRRSV
jgi:hypothetical protein